jgi:DNA helicase HerA-like ATPase
VNLEAQGGDNFFGEPEFEPADLMRQVDGKGVVTLLELTDQQANPRLWSTFLMWLLAELFEELPEAGDLDKPKLVFFLDEAHLLFDGASKAFLERIEQTVKLIRSKGVGVFFCTQLPTDIPNEVLSQLGARVQHALRAFTPEDQTALSKTVRTYPRTEVYDMEKALTSLGIGEAIVTVLSERGAPTPVAWVRMRAPRSLMAAIGPDAVTESAKASPLYGKYGETVDRESAYEKLTAKIAQPAPAPADAPPPPPAPEPERRREEPSVVAEVLGSPVVKSFLRSAASALGREITRGLFGTRRRR